MRDEARGAMAFLPFFTIIYFSYDHGGDGKMNHRKRNTAIVLIAAGLYIIVGNLIGYFTVTALLVIWLGIYTIRSGETNTGYVLLAVGALLLISGNFAFFVAIILFSLGYFFIRNQQVQKDNYIQKHHFMESIKRNQSPWELRNMSIWSIIGEIDLDLSLAYSDQAETTLVYQGIIADVDILIPEDLGVAVYGTILLGQTHVSDLREAGVYNKVVWKSPNYDSSEQKVHIEVSYLIGDLHIRRL